MFRSQYIFRANENFPVGFIRILKAMSDEVNRLGRRPARNLSVSIHDLHLLIKRLRTLLWIAKPILEPTVLLETRKRLRHASRLLTTPCDRRALQATLGKFLKKKFSRDGSSRTPTQQSQRQAAAIITRTIEYIENSSPSSEKWPLLSTRLNKAFRVMHKSAKKAHRNGKSIDYHKWRKKSKQLLYTLELTRTKKHPARLIHQADKLQHKLGQYHDCVVTQAFLKKNPSVVISQDYSAHLKKRKKHLRGQTRKIAARISSCVD